MKKLLLLLIIPTLSYSQITYDDVMSINSEKTFKRGMIENGLDYDDDDNIRYYNHIKIYFMPYINDFIGL